MVLTGIVGCSRDGDPGVGSVPAQTSWTMYRGVAVPVSAVDGPAHADQVAPTGYSHTPQGAVLAAIQGQARLALADDGSWPQVAGTLVAPSPGRDAFSVARSMMSIPTDADPTQTAQFAGFKVADYSDEQATVWLATAMPDGTLSAQPTQVVWQGGDWKLDLPQQDPNAETVGTDPVPVSSLTDDGYTSYSAN